ncbi:MAG: peptide-methionine (S)-S-oxide reductase MsrA [Xanthomonadales bacterium]|nr:peptide-methionine (S)-S-oxide reductase MsrA [Xanthomonadales bacterium]NNL94146.1 peptide-methionine (S)-S-oxide reductase MsrA [Xanthomonadales bacterium]
MEKATFGAGCFWGVEVRFREVAGVVDAAVGYMGGHTENPTYKDVCTGRTGHAEVVELDFDTEQVSYDDLLEVFFSSHNPTTRNRQGPDVGTQYRSVIFTRGEEQQRLALAAVNAANDSGRWNQPVVTEVTAAGAFWRAEEYHQQYLAKNENAFCHV